MYLFIRMTVPLFNFSAVIFRGNGNYLSWDSRVYPEIDLGAQSLRVAPLFFRYRNGYGGGNFLVHA